MKKKIGPAICPSSAVGETEKNSAGSDGRPVGRDCIYISLSLVSLYVQQTRPSRVPPSALIRSTDFSSSSFLFSCPAVFLSSFFRPSSLALGFYTQHSFPGSSRIHFAGLLLLPAMYVYIQSGKSYPVFAIHL